MAEREREKGKEKEIRNTLRDGMRKRDKGRKRAIETETEGKFEMDGKERQRERGGDLILSVCLRDQAVICRPKVTRVGLRFAEVFRRCETCAGGSEPVCAKFVGQL